MIWLKRQWNRVWLGLGLYHLISRFRRICDHAFQLVRWPDNILELETILNDMIWEKDGLKDWFDTIQDPRTTYMYYELDKPAGDCDDIACFAANALHRIGYKAYLLTILWDGGGHSVAAFKKRKSETIFSGCVGVLERETWCHIGNWHNGQVKEGYASLKDLIESILGDKVCTGWCLATPDIKHIERFGTGKEFHV